MFGRAEPGDIPELSSKDGTKHWADPADHLDCLIAGVTLELLSNTGIELDQFGVVGFDHTP